MSFVTSLGLSANNLRTKKRRTVMTAFAGSIGIIGIALILALSSGVNEYIQSIEEETLSKYPLQITGSEFDITSLLSTMSPAGKTDDDSADSDAEISVTEVITTMFSQMNSNDLASLKTYLESGESDIWNYVTAIEYTYDLDPQIYLQDGDAVRQVNPDTSMSSSGNSILSMMSSSRTTTFYVMPENTALYESQYDVVAGHWPESYNECVLVLTENGSISDYMLYTLGLRDYSELDDMIEQYSNGEDVSGIEDIGSYTYEDVLGVTYKVVCAADYYAYDNEYDVWVDKTDNEDYLVDLVANGEDLTIVGVVLPTEDATSAALTSGINYPVSLVYHMAELAEECDAVQAQMANPDINILTGAEFGEDSGDLDMSSMITINEDALANAFDLSSMADSLEIDTSSIELDTSSLDIDMSSFDLDMSSLEIDMSSLDIDMSSLDLDLSSIDIDMSSIDLSDMIDLSAIDMSSMEIDLSGLDMSNLLDGISLDVSTESLSALTTQILDGYQSWLDSNGGASYEDLTDDFTAYLTGADAKSIFTDFLDAKLADSEITVSQEGLAAAIKAVLPEYVSDGDSEGDGEGTSVDVDAIVDAVVSYVNDNAAVSVSVTDSDLTELAGSLSSGYAAYAQANGLTTSESINESFSAYLSSDAVSRMVYIGIMSMVDFSGIQDSLSTALNSYMQTALASAVASYTETLSGALEEQMAAAMDQMRVKMTGQLTEQISAAVTQMMEEMMEEISARMSAAIESMVSEMMEEITEQLSDSMETMISEMIAEIVDEMPESLADSMTIDSDTLTDAFEFNMGSNDLTDLLTSMSSYNGTDYDSNLAALGYIDFNTPSGINIYPVDFEAKDAVVAILDDYNDQMEASGEEGKMISYTDMVATMMSSVTTIINTVTYVLIAFIAVSLIVSCIMISVITQISVMERTKEIGILRALGASERNVTWLFNAETFIIGCCSGLIGVGVSELLIIPINTVIHALVGDISVNATLPWNYALLLVVISIAITVLSGLIPARSAAKKDPVTALRTE